MMMMIRASSIATARVDQTENSLEQGSQNNNHGSVQKDMDPVLVSKGSFLVLFVIRVATTACGRPDVLDDRHETSGWHEDEAMEDHSPQDKVIDPQDDISLDP
jgi:hypothetical protein